MISDILGPPVTTASTGVTSTAAAVAAAAASGFFSQISVAPASFLGAAEFFRLGVGGGAVAGATDGDGACEREKVEEAEVPAGIRDGEQPEDEGKKLGGRLSHPVRLDLRDVVQAAVVLALLGDLQVEVQTHFRHRWSCFSGR